jgi:hypothetical protein
MPHNYVTNLKGEEQAAINAFLHNIKLKENVKRKFLQRYNSTSSKEWMDDTVIKKRLAWEHQPGVLPKPWSMLAMDAFHGLLSDRLRSMIRNKTINPVIISSDMTSQLQPHDVY